MKTIGYCLTGSFLTFSKEIKQVQELKDRGYSIIPIMSYNAGQIDTRFGSAD